MRNYNILEHFFSLSKFDIQSFLERSLNFFRDDYILVINYYKGQEKEIPITSFERLQELVKECRTVLQLFQQHSKQMKNVEWWDLLEQVENIDSRLMTLLQASKWLRSSIGGNSFSKRRQVEVTLQQNQSLERLVRDVLNSQNSEDSWVSVALENQLEEEDYSLEGGNLLNLPITSNISTIQVNSVVDVIQGKSIYGKDIDKRLIFSTTDSEGDLEVLDYDDTIKQSVEILIDLKRGDNPDLVSSGLQKGVVVGGNRSLLNFPVITRQFSEVFATDDTLKDFKIEELSFENDNLIMSFRISTRLDEVQQLKETI